MAALIGAAFTGVQDMAGAPDKPITNAQIENVAKDHGYAFELLTNYKADGSGGAPTTAGHNHDETGNLLLWPVTTSCFGPEMPDQSDAYKFQDPPYVFSSSPSPVQGLVLFKWPIFVPPGFSGKRLLVVLEAYGTGDPATFASLGTWSTASPPTTTIYSTETLTANMGRVSFLRLRTQSYASMFDQTDGALYVAELTPATTGIHTVTVFRDIGNATVQQPMNYRSLHAYWAVDVNNDVGARPEERASSLNTVGDSHASNAFMVVDSTLTVADFPAGPALMMNQVNSAYLGELATGLPAGGNTTLTVAGHDHSNTGSAPGKGRGIEFTLYSEPYGSADSTVGSGAAAGTNVLNGRFRAPKTSTSTSFSMARQVALYTPVDAGSSSLYMAILVVNADPTKAGNIEVKVTPYPNGVGGTARTVTSTVGGAGGSRYELLTHGSTLAFQSGGYTRFDIEMRLSAVGGGLGTLLGVLFFFDR